MGDGAAHTGRRGFAEGLRHAEDSPIAAAEGAIVRCGVTFTNARLCIRI
jgi:hypothetical protein